MSGETPDLAGEAGWAEGGGEGKTPGSRGKNHQHNRFASGLQSTSTSYHQLKNIDSRPSDAG